MRKQTRILWAGALAATLVAAQPASACGVMMIDDMEGGAQVDDSEPYVFFTTPKLERNEAAIPQATLADAVSTLSQAFGFCYEDLLRRTPESLSEAKFRFEVARDGTVKGAKMTRTALSAKDSGFDACLSAAAADWKVTAKESIKDAFAFTTAFRFAPPLFGGGLAKATPSAPSKAQPKKGKAKKPTAH